MMCLRRIAKARDGAAAVEFALLAPLVTTLLFGVLSVGVQMQNYNAIRNVAGDISRYTVVEYQKSNKISAEQIKDVAMALAGGAKYNLRRDSLDVLVSEEGTSVANAKKIDIAVTYLPPDLLPDGVRQALSLTHRQSVIVPTGDES